MHGDPVEQAALATLFLPFQSNVLQLGDRVAFLRAREGAPLSTLAAKHLVCEQTFKPEADALMRAGIDVVDDLTIRDEKFDTVLVLPPRQRDEARALMTRAMNLAGLEGRVVVAASNNNGAKSLESDLAQLAGPVESLSKHKCRAIWTKHLKDASIDGQLATKWRLLDTPRKILGDRYLSRPGLFAWDRIDPASELLVSELPGDLAGHAADLGAGFGCLSCELLERCPGISSLDMYEAEARAIELARYNVSTRAGGRAVRAHWHDVTTGLPESYDVIVTNPPFHTGSGAEEPGLGRRFIAAAARALKPGGRLWLVANRHLPYENVLNANFGAVRTVTQRYGFKIVEAMRSGPEKGK